MEKIIAAIRIRPATEQESDPIALEQHGEKGVIAKKHSDKFSFESVFGQNTTNEDIFSGTVNPLLEKALKGYNICIFTYGQTSSGKTHTMKGSSAEPGIIPLSLKRLFDHITSERDLRAHANPGGD